MVLPDRAARELDPAWFDEGENIRVADAFVVGIILNACGETYETLKQYAETVDMDGLLVRTVNLEGLLRTKQTMHDKDVADRIILGTGIESVAGTVWKTDAGSGVVPDRHGTMCLAMTTLDFFNFS